jgi:hypothetical protein
MGKKKSPTLVAGKYTVKELGLHNRRMTAEVKERFIETFMSVTFEPQVLALVDRVVELTCESYETVVPIEVRRWYSMRTEQGWGPSLDYGKFGSYRDGDIFDLDIGDVPGITLVSLQNFSDDVQGPLYEINRFDWRIRSDLYLPIPSKRISYECLPTPLADKLRKLQEDIKAMEKRQKDLRTALRVAVLATSNVDDLFERMPGADEIWMEMLKRKGVRSALAPCSDIPEIDLFAKVIKSIKEAGK